MGGQGHRTIAHLKEAPIGKDDMASLNEKCGHDISMQRRTEGKYSFSKLKIENCPTDCVILLFCNVLSEEMFHIHSKSAMTS